MADLDPTTPAPDSVTEPEPSLAEHEATFGTIDRPPDPAAAAVPDDDTPAASRARDDQGKFIKPVRHRATSQQAGPADVPRIAELTKRLRETEAERDALKARSAPTLEPAAAAAAPAAEPTAGRAPTPASPAAAVKPKLDDFQEYGDYVEALADWKISEARRQDRETYQKESEAAKLAESWRTRVDGAKTKYPDFEQVALKAPTTIPQGSLVDAWILEHRSGADVLYSLQKDPAELARILALPLFDQVEALSLLAQRLGQPAREPAVRTGAAATSSPKPAPRPPTPVRSGAMPAADEPPGDDASIASFEKFYYRDRSR